MNSYYDIFIVAHIFTVVSCAPRYDSVCYEVLGMSIGCFDTQPPFDDLPLPWKPSDIEPRLFLHTKETIFEGRWEGVEMDLDHIPSEFEADKNTKIIIHGLLADSKSSEWMHDIKNELLFKNYMNVIIVDWGKGARVLPWQYKNAASNTRLVAAYLAKLLNIIHDKYEYDLIDKVHCIGHSLGAHTCGFLGKALEGNLSRISGLDPAGPEFENKPSSRRLDRTDAGFVDVIHSHGEDGLIVDFGLGEQIGDVDFIPNGGGVQPGCFDYYKHEKFVLHPAGKNQIPETVQADVYGDIIGCSHSRSYHYYVESISADCPFTAVPCPDMQSHHKGECGTCTDDECQLMGYYSDTRPGRGVYYLETNSRSPYCQM